MSTTHDTRCKCAAAIELAREESKKKALSMSEHGTIYWGVAQELGNVARRHVEQCHICQAAEVASGARA